ncbi:MAG: hypothetical protein LJE68_08140 [Rhodobacter sp.]|nr:hypothetical protein [Rhodobacter sp.]
MKRFIDIFRRHPLLASGFMLALAMTAFFAIRTVFFVVYWADPAHRDQALQGWMTPGYVAHSWDVPKDLLAETLGIPAERTGQRRTLSDIAAGRDIALPVLIDLLNDAIAGHRAAQ